MADSGNQHAQAEYERATRRNDTGWQKAAAAGKRRLLRLLIDPALGVIVPIIEHVDAGVHQNECDGGQQRQQPVKGALP